MKFILNINANKYILTAEQLDAVVGALNNCERLDAKWVGSGKGDNGTDYINSLSSRAAAINVEVMPEDEYNLLKFKREVKA